MKKNFTLTVLLLFAVGAYSQTYISGFINANTTWNMAGSPYIVTANALVSQSYTLTIQPGVVVKFNTNRALQIDGQLIAIGTPSSHITFTSNQASPQAGDWGKLHFSGYCIGATFDANGHYLSGSIMKYADVLYAGGAGYGGVHIESSWPYISQCNVRLSKAAGIYCAGSTFILDSSLVADNTGYGLYFNDFSRFSCGLVINGDTIRNNAGGVYWGIYNGTCPILVAHNYFESNNMYGALYFDCIPGHTYDITIRNNYFFNNTGQASYSGIIYFCSYSHHIVVSDNFFSNNTVSQSPYGGGILFMRPTDNDTISCNYFLNNQMLGIIGGLITINNGSSTFSGAILNNIFDGTKNNYINGNAILYIQQQGGSLSFSHNIVRNTSSLTGNCIYIKANLSNNNELLHFDNNRFSNDAAQSVIYLDGDQTNNVNYDFLYMKHNNFLDVNYQIELYNHIPFGSPNVYADSNYWGSTSTAHVDSIISDYFDSTNYSVVYYSPILTQAIEIDTSCSLGFPTVVSEKKNSSVVSSTFPNPFSSFTTVTISKELKDASLFLFDVYGRKVHEVVGINGKLISLRRESLPPGIYLYEIIEKGERVANGKVVAE